MDNCPSGMIRRQEWGAKNRTGLNPQLRHPLPNVYFRGTDGYTHEYYCDNKTACMESTRVLQNLHTDENGEYKFADIAYNFIIGDDGSIMEGRGWSTKGAFRLAFNSNSIGVVFLGQFNETSGKLPSDAALRSADALVACGVMNGYLRKDYQLQADLLNPKITKLLTPYRNETEIMYIGIGIAAFIVLSAAIFGIFSLFWRRNRVEKTGGYGTDIRKSVSGNIVDYFEVPRWTVKLKKEHSLNSGQFGTVYEGTLNINRLEHKPVAVKVLEEGCRDRGFTADFLEEISIVLRAGRHANIVNLEGIVLNKNLMIIMEFCELGSLEQFLRNNRNFNSSKSQDLDAEGSNMGITSLDASELIYFAYQVSRGMAFLSFRHVIHHDLAARNILLTSTRTIKIANFGMSKIQENTPKKTGELELPICWMAPESILSDGGVYTTNSNVWSFGVVLWEIFSFADAPYLDEFPHGITVQQLSMFLQAGRRLTPPHLTPLFIEMMMKRCWELDPARRPDFTEFRMELELHVHSTSRAPYILIDATNDAWNAQPVSQPNHDSDSKNATETSDDRDRY